MGTSEHGRNEDGGYGGSGLVGSDSSGLRSAREAREVVDAARAGATRQRDDDGTPPVHGGEALDSGVAGADPDDGHDPSLSRG